jgi:hypothetical protein
VLKILTDMKDKTYNRIMAFVYFILGVGGVLVSLVHAIPMYGALGIIPFLLSIGILIVALDKDTD